MKKIITLLLTVLMVAALAGCGIPGLDGSSSSRTAEEILSGSDSKDIDDSKDSDDSKESDDSEESDDSDESDTYTVPEAGYPDEYGYAEGTFGDAMHTAFFEYTVNSAYLCDEYEGYEPSEGNTFLVADVTVHNPYTYTVPMYDTDFQVQWDSDAEDAFGYPITAYMDEDEDIDDSMLPQEYEVRRFEDRNGILVYEVPEGENYFSISYLEIYEDGTEGDVFFVYFSADYE